MEQKDLVTLAKGLRKAQLDLLRAAPFWGSLAMQLELGFEDCGTAYTDGKRICADPAFLSRMKTPEEYMFLLLHETLHCALHHLSRQGSRNHFRFNVAADLEVNSIALSVMGLKEMKLADSPVLHRIQGREANELSTEEIYELLGDDLPPKESAFFGPLVAAGEGCKVDDHRPWRQAVAQNPDLDAKWHSAVLVSAGTEPGDQIRKWLELEDLPRDVDWKTLLRDFLQINICDYTYARPDRRYPGPVILPSFLPSWQEMEGIWFLVDISGSISPQALTMAMNEIRAALQDVGGSGWISAFDTAVSDPVPFSDDEALRGVKLRGGGGTDFAAIFKKLTELSFRPAALVILTDGYADYPPEEAAEGIPTLWLLQEGGRGDPPSWGSHIRFRAEA